LNPRFKDLKMTRKTPKSRGRKKAPLGASNTRQLQLQLSKFSFKQYKPLPTTTITSSAFQNLLDSETNQNPSIRVTNDATDADSRDGILSQDFFW
jgi:hypothetical protein